MWSYKINQRDIELYIMTGMAWKMLKRVRWGIKIWKPVRGSDKIILKITIRLSFNFPFNNYNLKY